MWSVSEVKEIGKSKFKANYWPCVLVAVLMGLFTAGSSASVSSKVQETDLNASFNSLTPEQQAAVIAVVVGAVLVVVGISLVVKIFLANPIELGGSLFFKQNVEETPASLDLLKAGFQNYGHTFATLLLRDVFTLLWCLLLLIPGIVAAYAYRMVPFILAENPDMPAREVIARSREMMRGNKWRAFVLDLSVLGWIILGVVTLGLGLVFWTEPYIKSADAALYVKLKEQQG